MERALYLSGIGGQGIQLAAHVLARAALAEGREVQVFGSYGGMMRGGNTEATVVVGDLPVESPPTVAGAWCVLLMHHDYADAAHSHRCRGGLLLVNTTVYEGDIDDCGDTRIDVPATDLAIEVGNVMAASMVMVGALATSTRIVELDSLERAVGESLPSYRQAHVELNERALRAGARAARPDVLVAWDQVVAP